MDDCFKYKTAIVRNLATSLPAEAQRQSPESSPVDWGKAVKQHENYVDILRNEIGLKIIELPADDKLPDCVFVEDVAVVIRNKALITTPGHESRQGETDAMQECLQHLGLDLTIMKKKDPNALMDGGDILFTGKEILVGISSRTNEAGCTVLEETFSEFPVTSIPVKSGLHLKSFCSIVSPGIILLSNKTSAFREIGEKIKSSVKTHHNFLEVDEKGTGANCLYIVSDKCGTTIVHPPFEIYPNSRKVYEFVRSSTNFLRY